MQKRKCAHCGETTVELTEAEYKALSRPVKPVVVEKVVFRSSRLTRRARLFLKRGCDVPEAMERDWETLKKSGLSSREAAASLGLVYFEPNARSE